MHILLMHYIAMVKRSENKFLDPGLE